MALISCPYCGNQVSDKAKVCPSCSNQLKKEIAIEETPIICKDCGTEIPHDAKVCPKCGCPISVKNEISEESSQQKAKNASINLPNTKKFTKKQILITLLIVLVIGFGLIFMNYVANKNKNSIQLMFKEAKQGDIISFGNYEQDGDTSNGKEAISWIVLEKEKDKVLVISENVLDCKPYHTQRDYMTWSECSLRAWLNNDFMKEVFSNEEQSCILKTNVINDDNPEYGTDGGEDTLDYIYLLSIEEANTYFTTANTRKALATKYAMNQGVFNVDGIAWWWLRSSGHVSENAVSVFNDGYVYEGGTYVDVGISGIRPALWINLES